MGDPLRLFPLGIVLLPGMRLPLHIFEERYRVMIRECLAEGSEFGVVLYEGGNLARVGCRAWIIQVLREYEDGRMDILTHGRERFRILETMEDRPYLRAEVEPFRDEPEEPSARADELAARGIKSLKKLGEMVDRTPDEAKLTSLPLDELSFYIAAADGFERPEKQKLLEMRSTTERLEKGVEALTHIIERLRMSLEIRRIIGGNGHIPGFFPRKVE